MMITPLGTGGGCHVSVMVVKVLLKAWSPVTGPGAGEEEDEKDGGTEERRTKSITIIQTETNCSGNVCLILARYHP